MGSLLPEKKIRGHLRTLHVTGAGLIQATDMLVSVIDVIPSDNTSAA